MRRGRIFFYLAFILILGLVAVYVITQRFLLPAPPAAEGGETVEQPVVNTVEVVVVTQKVQRGSLLNESVTGLAPLPQDLVVGGMYTDLEQVVGRQVQFDLEAGILLTEGMLVDPTEQLSGPGSVAALSIPPGMVAVSIPIDRLSSVSYAPRPGDHVNVILTTAMVDLDTEWQSALPNLTGAVISPGPLSDPVQLTASLDEGYHGRSVIDPVLGQTFYITAAEDQRPRKVTQTLLQDVVVLQMGNFPLEEKTLQPGSTQDMPVVDPAVEGNVNGETTEAPAPPEVITLIVSPQDSVTLNYLVTDNAKLTLALRSAGDASRVETESVTLQFLLDQYNIQIPAKLPYGLGGLEPVRDVEQAPVQ